MMLLGWRAIPLKRGDGGRVSRLDRAWVVFLAVLSLCALPLGYKRWPMFVLGGVGLVLARIDWLENRSGTLSPERRLKRHMRYMIASLYYVVTLLSILLFPGTYKVKWVWPSAIGAVVVLLLTRPELRARLGWSRTDTTRAALRFSAMVAVGLGLIALYDFATTGRLFAGLGG